MSRSTRRQFIKTSAVVTTGYFVAGTARAAESKSPNEQLQFACIGIGGKGASDSRNASRHGKIYAICDVDRQRLEAAARGYRTEHTFTDFREMLDQLGDKVDAVTVSTPDHCHAPAAAKAMKMGKHCYCQKPLTHSIWEARKLGEIAREMGVATQMGNQGTNNTEMRKAAYQIREGQVGPVTEVHIWTNRPVWPQGEPRPTPIAVPDTLDWQSWIGPAPFRPYGDGYHPFKWRGWWDFGTGALGDMACHTCNLPFMALNMRDPVSVQAVTSTHNGDSYPASSMIDYEFPELDGRPGFKMTWYDGGNRPAQELFEGIPPTVDGEGNPEPLPVASGVLIVGTKGRMYAAGDYADGGIQIVGEVPELDVEFPQPTPPASREQGHVQEWINAIRDRSQEAVSNFPNYAGPLTETILLGNLAVWNAKDGQGDKIAWDAKALECKSHPNLEKIVRREYRDGYEV